MKKAKLGAIAAFVSEDGSAIQELVGKTAAIKHAQFSIAQVVVPPGTKAQRHFHHYTEELYLVTAGSGRVVVDDVEIPVSEGDTVFIDIGERHYAVAAADTELKYLAVSLPAYAQEDFIVED